MNYWFRLGIIIMIYAFIPSSWGKLIAAIVVLIFLFFKKQKRSVLIFIICLLISYLLSNLPLTKPPETFEGKVALVKDKYFLVLTNKKNPSKIDRFKCFGLATFAI